jgi:hypothetical protein
MSQSTTPIHPAKKYDVSSFWEGGFFPQMSGIPSVPYIPRHLLLNPPPKPETSQKQQLFPVFHTPAPPRATKIVAETNAALMDEQSSALPDISHITQSIPKVLKLGSKNPVRLIVTCTNP